VQDKNREIRRQSSLHSKDGAGLSSHRFPLWSVDSSLVQ